jgi:hypothetical protein
MAGTSKLTTLLTHLWHDAEEVKDRSPRCEDVANLMQERLESLSGILGVRIDEDSRPTEEDEA